MSWRTSKLGIAARNLGRKLGINRRIGQSRLFSGAENNPDDAFLATIRAGDCVWDVGANVGAYTVAFADRAGPTGQVLAFEPSRRNRAKLIPATGERANVKVREEALGASVGTLRFIEDDTPDGVTSSIDYTGSHPGAYEVVVTTADALLTDGAQSPNVVKIDVEGAERDVLDGMAAMLRRPELHTVYVEVHFGILERRGRGTDPASIEATLKGNGFVPRWIDASHILAQRHPGAAAHG